MILKASQRSGRGLAAHLLNERDNDFVEVGRIQGFIATDIVLAFEEIEAVSRATKCIQPFFSLSLSPPPRVTVLNQDFEDAAQMALERLGLSGHPNALVYHEKEGRRHAHLVVSRITPEMRAVNLPYFKERLNEVARELYLSHGWQMPPGMEDRTLSDPLNFGLEEWQLALREGRDPREIKALFQRLWSRSDSGKSFAAALREKGITLCRGDRRGYVAVDCLGNVFSLTRWIGIRSKELAERIGDPAELPTVRQAALTFSAQAFASFEAINQAQKRDKEVALAPLVGQRREIVGMQRVQRQQLAQQLEATRNEAAKRRSNELRRGLKGLFDWITGRRKKTAERHRLELVLIAESEQRQLLSLRQRQSVERQRCQSARNIDPLSASNIDPLIAMMS